MPEVTASNRPFVSHVHNAPSRYFLHRLSKNLQACKIMLATIPKTDNGYKVTSAGISMMLDYISESLGQYADEIKKLNHENSGKTAELLNEPHTR